MSDVSPTRLLTVVMPNFNYADFVGEAIASVAEQSHSPIELIVVDDASTDNSVEQIEAALAKADNLHSTRLIALEENAGKLGAINRAIEHIHGQYLIILDSDDKLTPDYVKRTMAELDAAREEDPKIAFVYTDCMLISDKGEVLERGKSAPFQAELLERFSFIPEPAICITGPVLDAAPFDEAIRKGTKHHKWLRMVHAGWKGKHMAEPLFQYRMHGSNLSNIGNRVISEVESGEGGERILSGYWPLQTTER